MALASATALRLAISWVWDPYFRWHRIPLSSAPGGWQAAVVFGLLAGGLASLLTRAVYATEDLFHKLPIHWMWWPAIGGLVVGLAD